MTPEQALQVLAQVAAMAAVPLATHQQAMEAAQVLHAAIAVASEECAPPSSP